MCEVIFKEKTTQEIKEYWSKKYWTSFQVVDLSIKDLSDGQILRQLREVRVYSTSTLIADNKTFECR